MVKDENEYIDSIYKNKFIKLQYRDRTPCLNH